MKRARKEHVETERLEYRERRWGILIESKTDGPCLLGDDEASGRPSVMTFATKRAAARVCASLNRVYVDRHRPARVEVTVREI